MRIYYAIMASLNLGLVLAAISTDNRWWWIAAIFTAIVLFVDCLTTHRGTLYPLILVGGIFNFMAVLLLTNVEGAAGASMALLGSFLLFVGHVGQIIDRRRLKP